MSRTQVAPWVQHIVEDVSGGAPFQVGDTVKHPSGRTVTITGGQYWGRYGLSNFWCWREVTPKGLGPEEEGYGWDP